MPLKAHTHTVIEEVVTDYIAGVIKQKMRYLGHGQESQESDGLADGECVATIRLRRRLFAAVPGDPAAFGLPLPVSGFAQEVLTLSGANNKIVDAATGQILAMNTGLSAADWRAAANAYPQDVLFQGDYFEHQRDNAGKAGVPPLNETDQIRFHIRNADAMGLFLFQG